MQNWILNPGGYYGRSISGLPQVTPFNPDEWRGKLFSLPCWLSPDTLWWISFLSWYPWSESVIHYLSSQLVNCDHHSMIQFRFYQGSPYWLYMYTTSKCQYHKSFYPDLTLRHLKLFKLNSMNCCQFTNWRNLLAALEMQTLWWIVAHLGRALNLLGLEVLCSSQYEFLCAFTGYSWWCASVVSNVDSRYLIQYVI